MPFFLGIDGGGTKTRCVIGDEKSQLGAGSSSSSKVQRVGEACARDALAAAVNEACVQAGISPRQIVRTCAGITGAARPEIAGVMRDLVASCRRRSSRDRRRHRNRIRRRFRIDSRRDGDCGNGIDCVWKKCEAERLHGLPGGDIQCRMRVLANGLARKRCVRRCVRAIEGSRQNY